MTGSAPASPTSANLTTSLASVGACSWRRHLTSSTPSLDSEQLENRQYELLPGDLESQDESFVSIFARRPVFEFALRRAVEDEAKINVATNTRVVDLVSRDDSRGGGVRVTGARTSRGEVIEADLFVDALGRTSPLVSWLASLGARPPLERRAECGLIYYSRHFRFRPGVEMPTVPSLHRVPRGEIGYLAFGMFVEDNRTFALVLMIPPWERDLRVLRFEKAVHGYGAVDAIARAVGAPRSVRRDNSSTADGQPAKRPSLSHGGR